MLLTGFQLTRAASASQGSATVFSERRPSADFHPCRPRASPGGDDFHHKDRRFIMSITMRSASKLCVLAFGLLIGRGGVA